MSLKSELSDGAWRKSSKSSQDGNCVEILLTTLQ
ncbi:DUF397 domain-containing protein [Actinoallomurus sp. CA-150999]